jgi:hypothetical protein
MQNNGNVQLGLAITVNFDRMPASGHERRFRGVRRWAVLPPWPGRPTSNGAAMVLLCRGAGWLSLDHVVWQRVSLGDKAASASRA